MSATRRPTASGDKRRPLYSHSAHTGGKVKRTAEGRKVDREKGEDLSWFDLDSIYGFGPND